jgi:hypothetical protein
VLNAIRSGVWVDSASLQWLTRIILPIKVLCLLRRGQNW